MRRASAQNKARAKSGMDEKDLGRDERKTDYLLFWKFSLSSHALF